MATRLETLERVLLLQIALEDGNIDKLRKAMQEVIEEARSQRKPISKQGDATDE